MDDRRKKNKRKKRGKDKISQIKLQNLQNPLIEIKEEQNTNQSVVNIIHNIEISSSDEDTVVKKKKKKKNKCHSRKSNKINTSDSEEFISREFSVKLENWNFIDNGMIKPFENAKIKPEFERTNTLCKKPELIEIRDDEEIKKQAELQHEIEFVNCNDEKNLNEFYEKVTQLSNQILSDDDEEVIEVPFSSQKNSNSFMKIREKKFKHKNTCRKSKKFRTDNSRLRELLNSTKNLENSDNLSVYDNTINSNEFYRVNNINDIFVSSINAPEYEVELETTPLEHLSKQEQITIMKIETPEKMYKNTLPWKPDVTVEYKNTDNEIINIDNNLKAIKEKILYNDTKKESAIIYVNENKPAYETVCKQGKNYLMQAVNTIHSNTKVNVPIINNNTINSDSTSIITESIPAISKSFTMTSSLSLIKKKNCKYCF